MGIERHYLKPTAIRDNGRSNLNIADIKLPDFQIKETSLIYLPPGEYGGNHKHPRREAFIGTEDVAIVWQDEQGKTHNEALQKGDLFCAVIVYPDTPHVLINTSKTSPALIYELADGEQHNVQRTDLI